MQLGVIIELMLLTFIVLLLGVGGPLLGLHWLRKWLLRRDYRRGATAVKGIAVTLLLFCGYIAYVWFFPPDSHFESKFEQIAGVPFPASGEIIVGDESGFDPHGDYSSCARLQVSGEEYDQLLRALSAASSFRTTAFALDTSFVSSQEYQNITKELPPNAYYRTFSRGVVWKDAYFFIGFLRDHRTIIAYRCSS